MEEARTDQDDEEVYRHEQVWMAALDAYIEHMRQATAIRLRYSRGDSAAIASAVEYYLCASEFDTICLSPSTMAYHFNLEEPSVPRLAGCDSAAAEQVMKVYWAVAWQKWCPNVPVPPGSPWYEAPDA